MARNIHSSRQVSSGCTASVSAVEFALARADAVHTVANVQRRASAWVASCFASSSSTQVSPGAPACVAMCRPVAAGANTGSAAQREAPTRIAASVYVDWSSSASSLLAMPASASNASLPATSTSLDVTTGRPAVGVPASTTRRRLSSNASADHTPAWRMRMRLRMYGGRSATGTRASRSARAWSICQRCSGGVMAAMQSWRVNARAARAACCGVGDNANTWRNASPS